MIVCWSAKGGAGVSVVAALLAQVAAERSATTLVDLCGDQEAIWGLPQESTIGIRNWLDAGSGVMPSALSRLSVEVNERLTLQPWGTTPATLNADDPTAAARRLAYALPNAIVDAGLLAAPSSVAKVLATKAPHSLLITRACYLALRNVKALAVASTGIILVEEPRRSLDASDVSGVAGAPVVAQIPFDPALMRAVDAGTLASYRGRARKPLARLLPQLEAHDDAA